MQVRNLNRTAAVMVMLLIFSLQQSAAQSAHRNAKDGSPTVRLDVDLVSLNVVVTDHKGQPITELAKADFKVYEDRVEQPISFFSHEETPVSWGLVLDR